MSMRSQVYEWANLAPSGSTSSLRRGTNDVPVYVAENREYDVFIGGIGNNITKPAETTATQFIVIEDIASTPYLGGAVQIRINTTDYFQIYGYHNASGSKNTRTDYGNIFGAYKIIGA